MPEPDADADADAEPETEPDADADASAALDPSLDRRDAAARSGDLARMAEANTEATFGTTDAASSRMPGVISGDVGPKGKTSAQLRALSRSERATYGEVPTGSVSPGGAKLLLLPMLAIAAFLIALVVLLGWLAS